MFDEDWEGYRDWTEAAEYYGETDSAGICTPSIGFEDYSVSGQRNHLALAITNTAGGGQSVSITSTGVGLGMWVQNTVLTSNVMTISFRYKAPADFAGCTIGVTFGNGPFAQTVQASPAICDGEWHTVTGTWNIQIDSVVFNGNIWFVSGIPDGADGTVRLDDIRVMRNGQIQREIDNTLPVVPLRIDWADGYRETYGWLTALQQFEDGNEYRENLRLIPSCRLEYSVRALNAEASGKVDQFLYRYHGQLVAVPRWQDAVPFASTASSGHEVFTSGDFSARWFAPRQRFMVWESEDNYEVEIVDTINTTRITLDPGEGALTGTFTPGYAKIVPLVPARFVPDLSFQRPNNQIGIYPLAFDVQMVQ